MKAYKFLFLFTFLFLATGAIGAWQQVIKQFAHGGTYTTTGIFFDAHDSLNTNKSRAELAKIEYNITRFSKSKIEISTHVHTDVAADKHYQQRVSRARILKKYFISKGIAAGRISTVTPHLPVPPAAQKGKAAEKQACVSFKILFNLE